MPQLGETVTEGTITRWAKQVGEKIEEDDILFEVSTDKVDSEVPSPVAGYLAEILVPEGETVDVGTKLAVISSEAPSGDGAGGGQAAAPVAEAAESEETEPAEEPAPARAEAQPAAVAQRPGAGGPSGGGGTRPADERPPSRPSESGG